MPSPRRSMHSTGTHWAGAGDFFATRIRSSARGPIGGILDTVEDRLFSVASIRSQFCSFERTPENKHDQTSEQLDQDQSIILSCSGSVASTSSTSILNRRTHVQGNDFCGTSPTRTFSACSSSSSAPTFWLDVIECGSSGDISNSNCRHSSDQFDDYSKLVAENIVFAESSRVVDFSLKPLPPPKSKDEVHGEQDCDRWC